MCIIYQQSIIFYPRIYQQSKMKAYTPLRLDSYLFFFLKRIIFQDRQNLSGSHTEQPVGQ